MRMRYAYSPIGSEHGTGAPGDGGGGEGGGEVGGGGVGGGDGGRGGDVGGGEGEQLGSYGRSGYCVPSMFSMTNCEPRAQLGPMRAKIELPLW